MRTAPRPQFRELGSALSKLQFGELRSDHTHSAKLEVGYARRNSEPAQKQQLRSYAVAAPAFSAVSTV